MGHAVYTKSDPRARLLRDKAIELAAGKDFEEELETFLLVEKTFPEVFAEMKGGQEICVNVDFYSGFVYKMLGIPTELFTPLFAVSRTPGWCAHRLEEIISGGKIIRPAYKCVQRRRPYTPISARESAVSAMA
jgi:citrate synthase